MEQRISWDRQKACCFTGHRNKDLPFGGNRDKQGMKCLASSIQLYIEQAIDDGYDTFISGMAEGIDLICAEIVHNLITRKGMDIKLICAVPYKGQHIKDLSSPVDKYIYSLITQDCTQIIYTSDVRSRSCYRVRNQFMVDNSSRIIGVFKDKTTGSGTSQTIKLAEKAGLDMKIIYLDRNHVFYVSDDFI